MKNWIKEEIKTLKAIIINRAKTYGTILNEEVLFYTEQYHPILIYSDKDFADHYSDLGKLNAFQEVLKKIEDKEQYDLEHDYEHFLEKYKPIQNDLCIGDAAFDNLMFETFGKEVEYIECCDNNFVWTIVDGPHEKMYIIPGKHLVNRLGYFVTEIPWSDPNEEYNMD